ncbi:MULTISPECIES: type II toxin-antitoxin system HicA family toxin [Methylobacterium]|uniref:type II toxin-antitoxin system HicA family toxin n=1 Tax=Methylobacterium TaxID=407 RepID=UPI00104397BA|nr:MULTISPECIES: type II toxin-antitoxin system HicA family toxin [Methylobacterium]MDR7035628.1 hypothetical protein [Methylobacterium sp. BE186]
MGQAEKRLDRMRRNPVGDWTIEDIAMICRAYGIDCVPPARGSHYDLSHPSEAAILTVPARRPVRPHYIRAFVAFVDAVRGAQDAGA